MVKIVSARIATFTKSVCGSTIRMPLSKSTCSCRVKAKAAADTQPNTDSSAPQWNRAAMDLPRNTVKSAPSTSSIVAVTIVSGAASRSIWR